MFIPKISVVKVLSLAATAIGFGATILSGYVEDKKLDEKVTEQVNKALADRK